MFHWGADNKLRKACGICRRETLYYMPMVPCNVVGVDGMGYKEEMRFLCPTLPSLQPVLH